MWSVKWNDGYGFFQTPSGLPVPPDRPTAVGHSRPREGMLPIPIPRQDHAQHAPSCRGTAPFFHTQSGNAIIPANHKGAR